MRVLLDTNVILDAMLQRAPWHVEADAILLVHSPIPVWTPADLLQRLQARGTLPSGGPGPSSSNP